MTLLNDLANNFFKHGTREIHWGKVVCSLIVLIALIAFIIYKNKDINKKEKERMANRRYTIGVTGKMRHNIKSSKPTVEYYYNVLGSKFKRKEHVDSKYEKSVVPNGGRYYVEFSSKDAANSKLLLGLQVPDSVINSPDSGWVDIVGN